MFSDTHFHLMHIAKRATHDPSVDLDAVFAGLAARDCRFLLDIGTEHDDLPKRLDFAARFSARFKSVTDCLHFSAGIWPSLKAITERFDQMESLKNSMSAAGAGGKLAAIGECGFDHHQTDFDAATDTAIVDDEYELFSMQLETAHKMRLPIIVHSRDAFDHTLSCIKNSSARNGIIHCFSYGIEEARQFLDLDFYISLSGAITYTKKNKAEQAAHTENLIRFIPQDKLLLETDSPYLAPMPHRGSTNTPLLVEHVYRHAALARGTTPEALSTTVDANIQNLFQLTGMQRN